MLSKVHDPSRDLATSGSCADDFGHPCRRLRKPTLAAVRAGDTLVVPKLDRLARSVPDARQIGDSLVARGIKLSLGGTIYDPADPMGKMFFNILATFAEFEVDLLRLRTREGMAVRARQGKAQGQTAQADRPPASRAGPHARYR
jgi:DNA invertase Pin-like site-specific DNA recombinase